MNSESKSVLASKTFWCSVLVAAAPAIGVVYPPAAAWLAANGDVVCTGLGALFGVLRLVTDKSVR